MRLLRKIFYSNLDHASLGHSVLAHQWKNAKDIWNNNDHQSNAIGIERILRIILILSQFLFPGIYFRAFFGRYGILSKHLGVELHVILKFTFSIFILIFDLYATDLKLFGINIFQWWCFWMIFETISYTSNLVFSEDVFAKPHSHKRNLILIVVDYITLNLDFSIIYLIKKSLIYSDQTPVIDSFEAVYFSMITSLTIGYGDVLPTKLGHPLVVFQCVVMLLFGILFLNFYLSRINSKE